MAEKRSWDCLPSPESKRQQMYNYEAILFTILETLHRVSPNLIQYFQSFSFLNRALHKIVSRQSTKTTLQEQILKRLLDTPPLLKVESPILPEHRLSTGPGTGKTRLMLEAAATIVRTKKQSVMILCSESFIPMYKTLLSKIDKANSVEKATRLFWFDAKSYVRRKPRGIVCLSTGKFSLPFAQYFMDTDIEYIFSDDYAMETYPRIVCTLRTYVFYREPARVLRYLAISANFTGTAAFSVQNDVQLAPPPTTVDFHTVTRCSLCPSFCIAKDDFRYEWTPETLPYPFDELFNVICRDELKVVLFMRFSYLTKQQNACIDSLLKWATKTGRTGKLIYARRSTPKEFGEQIAEFNSLKHSLIVFDSRRALIRGHSIYGSACVFINSISYHSDGHCAKEFGFFENPRAIVVADILQLIGRIRRPDSPFEKLRVIIYDASVCVVIPLTLSASGNFTMEEMKSHAQKFIFKNKVDTYNSLIKYRDIANRINAELFELEENLDKHNLQFSDAQVDMGSFGDHPGNPGWFKRRKALRATKPFLQRAGYPEHLCNKVREYLLSCLPAGNQKLFTQDPQTHFVIQFS